MRRPYLHRPPAARPWSAIFLSSLLLLAGWQEMGADLVLCFGADGHLQVELNRGVHCAPAVKEGVPFHSLAKEPAPSGGTFQGSGSDSEHPTRCADIPLLDGDTAFHPSPRTSFGCSGMAGGPARSIAEISTSFPFPENVWAILLWRRALPGEGATFLRTIRLLI